MQDTEPEDATFHPSFIVWTLVLGLVIFVIGMVALPASILIQWTSGIVLAIWAGVTVAYIPAVLEAFREQFPTSGHILGIGVLLSGLSIVGGRSVALLVRGYGITIFVDSYIFAFVLYMSVMAGLMHLLAPNVIRGKIPPKQWAKVGLYVACGLVLVFIFAAVADAIPGLSARAAMLFNPGG